MKRNNRPLVIFTGGGTAGHVHPAVEVIDQVWKRDRAICIAWFGSSRGVERRIVTQTFGRRVLFYAIPCGKLRRYPSLRNLFDAFRVVAGIVVATVLLVRRSPALVFSKGGYVSVPVVIAAGILRIPVISHESDITVGLATRINARFSTYICLPHRRALDSLSSAVRRKAIVSGTPIRQQILAGSADRGWRFVQQCLAGDSGTAGSMMADSGEPAPPTSAPPAAAASNARQQRRPVLLFVGGSSGAEQINRMVAEIGPELIATHNCVLVHQTGRQQTVRCAELAHEQSRGRYLPLPYIAAEMGDLLALATVIVSRAGANALWECATLKKAMVLVPLSRSSSRGDQLVNAELFREHGAALIADDAAALLSALGGLLRDAQQRTELGRRAHALIIPQASATLADLIFTTLYTAAPMPHAADISTAIHHSADRERKQQS